jgi:hypothetical protein
MFPDLQIATSEPLEGDGHVRSRPPVTRER